MQSNNCGKCGNEVNQNENICPECSIKTGINKKKKLIVEKQGYVLCLILSALVIYGFKSTPKNTLVEVANNTKSEAPVVAKEQVEKLRQSTKDWIVDPKGFIFNTFKVESGSGWPAEVRYVLKIALNHSEIAVVIPFREYKKLFTFKPNPFIQFNKMNYVIHPSNNPMKNTGGSPLTIDGIPISGFSSVNGNSWGRITSNAHKKFITSLLGGDTITFSRKNSSKSGEMQTIEFSLNGFNSAWEMIQDLDVYEERTFPPSGLICYVDHGRPHVWMNTNHGLYALNGPAIRDFEQGSWVNQLKLRSLKNKKAALGRDFYIDNKLISLGLKKCE